MPDLKMTQAERSMLNMLDQHIEKWHKWSNKKLTNIYVYEKDAKLFDSICKKIDDGLLPGNIDTKAKTYRDIPIRCQK
jgi:hypothetical protein